MKLALWILAASLFVPACLSPTPSGTVRFFEPPANTWEPAPEPGAAGRMNLVRVDAPSHLGRPMVWRRSEVELAFDERNRWAAEPVERVALELRRALFLAGPFTEADSRTTPRLEVRVATYEGVLGRPAEARVALVATLTSVEPPRSSTRRFESTRELDGSSAETLAHGLGLGLAETVGELREWLTAELAQ